MQPYKRSVMSSKVPQTWEESKPDLMSCQVRGVRAVVETVTENTLGNVAEAMCRRPRTLDLIH